MTCEHLTCCNHQRRQLLQGIAGGLITTLLPTGKLLAADFKLPPRLSEGRSVHRVSGHAWLNGTLITPDTRIPANATIKTAPGSKLVFAVGSHAMLLHGGAHLIMEGEDKPESPLVNLLRLFSGALLSASRHKGMQVITPAVTIGVRGTGIYLAAGPEKTYFCTCYGDTDVVANHHTESRDSVHSLHHDWPLFIYNEEQQRGDMSGYILNEPNEHPNHSDDELRMLEALVGRVPAFDESPAA